MKTNTVLKIVTICVVFAAIMMSGCIEEKTPIVVSTPEIRYVHITETPTPISTPIVTVKSEPTIQNDSIVIVMDVSGSMRDSEIVSESGVSYIDYEKELIITIMDDKKFQDCYVGTVGFGGDAHVISPLVYFGHEPTRESLKDTIRMIAPTGQLTTPLEDGLSMAEEMLANSAGAKDVIILSDGHKIDYGSSLNVATRMMDRGMRLHFIHVMSSPTVELSTYEKLANTTGSMYYQTSYPKSININKSNTAPTLTSTKVVPNVFPTPMVIDTPKTTPTITPNRIWVDYGVWANIGTLEWDHEDVVYFTGIRDKRNHRCMGERISIPKEHHVEGGAWHEDHIFLMYMNIFIDDQLIAEFKPTVVHGNSGFEVEELPMIISVPNGVDVDGEITVIGVYEFTKMHPYTNGQWHTPECDGYHPMSIDWHGLSIDEDFTEWNHY